MLLVLVPLVSSWIGIAARLDSMIQESKSGSFYEAKLRCSMRPIAFGSSPASLSRRSYFAGLDSSYDVTSAVDPRCRFE